MSPRQFPNLLSEFVLRGLSLRNRVAMAPMSSGLADESGRVSARQIAYFRERAAGGCGMITVEFTCVNRKFGISEPRQLVLEDESALDGHRALIDAVRAEGCAVALQLQMPGQFADPAYNDGALPSGPSDVHHPRSGVQLCRALDEVEILEIVSSFGRAARLAVKAGYQAIELHAAHGYLIAAFLSPLQNRRTDAWGGDSARRLAFPRAVIEAVRAEIGDRPLIYRLSADERVPGGLGIADTLALVPALEAAGVDAFHVSTGTLVGGLEQSVDPMSFPEGWRLDYAEALRSVTARPLMTVGLRLPSSAEAAVASGQTDLVSMGRAMLADPRWVAKVVDGRSRDIRPCTSCNWCMDRVFHHLPVACAENPVTGREDLPRLSVEAGKGLSLVVIGAGPGGIATALSAARTGFSVTLYERDERLGGGLIASAAPPFKDKLGWYRSYLVTQLLDSTVDLRTGHAPSVAEIAAMRPSAVVVATGASSAPVEDIEVAPGAPLYSAYDLLGSAEPSLPAGPCLVYGGGETGCETAELIAAQGREVHLVTRSDIRSLARAAEPLYRKLLRKRLQENPRVTLHDHTHLLAVDGTGAATLRRRAPGAEEESRIAVASVVVAQGRKRPEALIDALRAAGLQVHAIGDAREIGRIGDAVHDGHALISRLLGTEALADPA